MKKILIFLLLFPVPCLAENVTELLKEQNRLLREQRDEYYEDRIAENKLEKKRLDRDYLNDKVDVFEYLERSREIKDRDYEDRRELGSVWGGDY